MSSRSILFGFAFIVFLLFSYIQNFHESINFAADLTNLSFRSEIVYSEKEKINLDISKFQSLDIITSSTIVSKMVPVKNVEFLKLQANLARK